METIPSFVFAVEFTTKNAFPLGHIPAPRLKSICPLTPPHCKHLALACTRCVKENPTMSRLALFEKSLLCYGRY